MLSNTGGDWVFAQYGSADSLAFKYEIVKNKITRASVLNGSTDFKIIPNFTKAAAASHGVTTLAVIIIQNR